MFKSNMHTQNGCVIVGSSRLITMCCGINGIGNFIPPFFVFPRVNMKDVFLKGSPLGSSGAANPSGWMTVSNFELFFYTILENLSDVVSKKTVKRFVGQVLNVSEDGLKMKFSRRIAESKFKWPTTDDIAIIEEKQIEKILQPPIMTTKNDCITSFVFSNSFEGLLVS